MGRTPVDEQGRAVGEHDVGRTTFDHAAVSELARRFSTVPPDGLAASGVVVVGPDQELQALTAELEVRSELVDGAVAAFRSPQGRGVEFGTTTTAGGRSSSRWRSSTAGPGRSARRRR